MKRIISFTVLLLFLMPSWARSDDTTPSSSGTLSFQIENDAIAGNDRDYTSGMKLSWTSRWIPTSMGVLFCATSFSTETPGRIVTVWTKDISWPTLGQAWGSQRNDSS